MIDYSSSEATDSSQCANTDCLTPLVFSDPPAGTQLSFPAYVRLYSDVPGATIRYTIDGTEPDTLSDTYTAPILIESSGVHLRAIAHLEGADFAGCDPGPIGTTAFTNPSFPFVFSYACDTPDNAGRWDDFTSNGTNDHHWELQFTLSANTTIARLELYQLDALGEWTTGQAWSTDSPIHPWPDRPEDEFSVFPLVVFDTAVQQWTDYESSLGTFGAASYTWDLYGDVVIPASGLFRLDIILSDGTKLSQTIGPVCTVTPPLCAPPALPTVVGKCDGAIDVTFSGTVGQPYTIFAADTCGTGVFEEVAADTIATTPQTVEITGYTENCEVFIYVSIQEAGCPYKDSNSVVALPKPEPFVSIATNKTIVDPNESFTISWNSRHIGGAVCGGCLDGQVSIDQSLGCKTGNVVGSQATSQAVCGVYTYTITGCNTCGTAIASVQVEVRCAATCSAPIPDIIALELTEALCDGIADDCTVSTRCGPTLIVWDGRMFNNGDNGCSYSGGSDIGLCLTFPAGTVCGIDRAGAGVNFVEQIPASNSYWELTVSAGAGFEFTELWTGRKTVGNGPVGTYTRVGGCATSPGSLTVS